MNSRPADHRLAPLVSQAVRTGMRHSRMVRALRILFAVLLIGGLAIGQHNASADEVSVPNTANLATSTAAGFMQTTTVTPQPVTAGAATTIATTVMAMQTTLVNGIIDIEVYNAANQKVAQQYFSGQTISNGQSDKQSYSWTAPSAGSYRVAIGVFGPNWSPLYLWAANAATITVTSPAPATSTAVASTPTFSQVTTVTPVSGSAHAYSISTTLTDLSGSVQNGVIDIEIYNAAYQKVGQQSFSGQNFAPGQRVSQTIQWSAPGAGTYQVGIGVFASSWNPNYFWALPAATFSDSGTAATATSTNTMVPATATSTNTAVPPSSTRTAVPPSSTRTATPVTGTSTKTAVPATATSTSVQPTSTSTPVAPTATATGTGGSSNVPVPSNLAAQPDDRAAVLTWNADMKPNGSDPPGVQGYKITWGPQSNPTLHTALSTHRIIEAQPLVNGQPYVASVQAIDSDGHLSAPSAVISFSGDSSRVDALRQKMTGFFDDFNDPSLSMLAPDARKWNTAVAQCNNNPATEGMFLNDQSHVHNLIEDTNCDRGQQVSRPRAVFDFTGRTGTIAFDLDGVYNRNFWYLDLVPHLMDIDSDTNLDASPTGTANMLRFEQTDQRVWVCVVDNSGNATCPTNTAPAGGTLDWSNLTVVPNVRRHWVLHVSQTHADITVNGVVLFSTDALHLSFSQAQLLWSLFSYNTHKPNYDRVLMHWDNFGFDGPAPATETHNYVDQGCCGGGDFASLNGSSVTKTIQIPDQLTGETAERLMFTMQPGGSSGYQWNSGDKAAVNGYTCSVAQPSMPQGISVSPSVPYSEVCNLPKGTLHTGTNNIAFTMAASGALNVHAEIDFPKGQAPSYTQPGLAPMPMSLPDIGPGATVDQIGTCSDNSCKVWSSPHGPFNASGVTPIAYSVDEDAALVGNGKAPGVREVQLTVDGQVVMDRRTDAQAPAPTVQGSFNLDTKKFSNGSHVLRMLAWNANGTISTPNYFLADATEGTDWPITLQIHN